MYMLFRWTNSAIFFFINRPHRVIARFPVLSATHQGHIFQTANVFLRGHGILHWDGHPLVTERFAPLGIVACNPVPSLLYSILCTVLSAMYLWCGLCGCTVFFNALLTKSFNEKEKKYILYLLQSVLQTP